MNKADGLSDLSEVDAAKTFICGQAKAADATKDETINE